MEEDAIDVNDQGAKGKIGHMAQCYMWTLSAFQEATLYV